jgi:hypothetical protein
LIRIHPIKYMATMIVLIFALAIESAAQFETRSSSPVIYLPQAVAVADFNHDGKLDVAAAAYYTGQVAVMLGRGDGTFEPAVYYTIDSSLESVAWVAASDFRGDGNVDLAVADRLGQNISILLGNGDGTFQSPVQYPTTQFPTFVAVGDFNNDGKPDLIVADGQYVSVLLGNGDGTFQPPKDNSIFSPAGLIPLAVGNFNHDGNLDAAVLGLGSLQLGILLGNGDGTFREGTKYAVGGFSNSIIVGDFNGDHKPDLAVTNGTGNQIYILLGKGDGTFQSEPPFFANGPGAINTADVNGDGKLDLLFIASLPNNPNQFTVMLGNGDGTFQAPVYYPSFVMATNIGVGDFNGDHKPDVAIADWDGNAVGVLLNTGVVSFSPTTPLSFNPQLVGTTSTPLMVKLTNTGATTLTITSISVHKPFLLGSKTTCGTSVAPGAKCTLSVVFEPTVMGFKTGLLVLNDSASNKSQVIELSATGTWLTVSPTQLNFGDQKVGTKSAPQNVTVTNTGNSAVSVTGVSITGADYNDYFETNTCGSQINPGAACTVSITFEPIFRGTRSALMVINGPGGAVWQQVQLTGTGT